MVLIFSVYIYIYIYNLLIDDNKKKKMKKNCIFFHQLVLLFLKDVLNYFTIIADSARDFVSVLLFDVEPQYVFDVGLVLVQA